MEADGIDKGISAEAQQEVYAVKLRTPLVNHFRSGLSPIYAKEMEEVQKDGAYQKVLDFRNSPFSKLMNKLAPPHDDNESAPQRLLELTNDDIAIMTKKIPTPINDLTNSRTHQELINELNDSFQNAKFTSSVRKHAAKVKAFLTRK